VKSEEAPPPTVEGHLIREARESLRPRLSIAAAADRAGISEKQWGDIERGYNRRAGEERFTRVKARADTLAAMVMVVPLSPGEIEQIIRARPEAAKALRSVADASDGAAADKLIERLIGRTEQPHREVLEWRWNELDAEGNLKPRRERIAALDDWIANHMGDPADHDSETG
jgi:hypothetical protein